jgi:GntR family transcriptional repressor for pyruvate dehydrogenase complex
MTTNSIKPRRTAAGVAEHIEGLIREGTLRPGERLRPEREVAERLGVSRPTLREGLRLLQEKGMLSSEPGGATRVAQFGGQLLDPIVGLLAFRPETTDDYYEFRESIEGTAAFLAAQRATAVELDAISACMRRIDEAHEERCTASEAEADADLHVAIYEATNIVVVLHVMRAFSGMLRAGMFHSRERLYAHCDVRSLLREQHRAIHDAIARRDPEAARDAASRHVSYTRQALREIRAAEQRLDVALRRTSGNRLSAAEEA